MNRFGESFHNMSMPNIINKANETLNHKEDEETVPCDEVKFSTGDTLPIIEEEGGKRSSTDSGKSHFKTINK